MISSGFCDICVDCELHLMCLLFWQLVGVTENITEQIYELTWTFQNFHENESPQKNFDIKLQVRK